MDELCRLYLAQISRLYGPTYAEHSICRPTSGYMVAVWPEIAPEFQTKEELELMIKNLSASRYMTPTEGPPHMAVLANKLNKKEVNNAR